MGKISDFRILRLPETDSTNTRLKALMQDNQAAHGCVVITDFQTRGKGYAGNHWESEPGKNLLLSVLLGFDYFPAESQFVISQAVSLSLLDVLAGYTSDLSVKWPNDLYHQNKKIAGILIENQVQGARLTSSLVGIGINLNQENFYSNAPNPISLKQLTGMTIDRELFLSQWLESLTEQYDRLEAGELQPVREAYLKHLYRINEWHPMRIANREEILSITGVNAYGMLQLMDQKGNLLEAGFKEIAFLD